MNGINFNTPPAEGFNPLGSLPSIEEMKQKLEASRKASGEGLSPSSLLLFEELANCGVDHPDDFLSGLIAEGLSQFTFHVICNAFNIPNIEEDYKDLSTPIEILDIEPLDIQKNPEKAAWAVQNQAFLAFRNLVPADGNVTDHAEIKIAPRWADRIQQGKIKQLRMKNGEGQVERTLKGEDIMITQLTAEQVDCVSTVIFKAVDIAFKIRAFETQLKAEEKQRKKDLEERENRERQLREDLFLASLRSQSADDKVFVSAKGHAECLEQQQSHLFSESVIERMMKKRLEELKEAKKNDEWNELHEAIIHKEIKVGHLKREILRLRRFLV